VRKNVSTNITLTEAGQLDFVYSLVSPNNDDNPSLNQLRLWAPTNPLYVGNRPKVMPILAAHSYWTDDSDSRLFNIRNNLVRAMRDTNSSLRWWQTEYSFLGNGWQDLGTNPTRHELGLVMAKVIHADLTIGNAAAWQFWETFESTTGHPRYRLVRVDRTAQTAVPEKTYWALGHYSRFIRPGMRRLHAQRSDALTTLQTLRDVMPTVFHNPATGDVTVVLVNYRTTAAPVTLNMPGVGDTTPVARYLSTETLNMARQAAVTLGTLPALPARSLTTLVFKTNLIVTSLDPAEQGVGTGLRASPATSFEIRRAGGVSLLISTGVAPAEGTRMTLWDIHGREVFGFRWNSRRDAHGIPVSLNQGVYFLRINVSSGTPAGNSAGIRLVVL
jgi:hypothetical protein